MPAFGIHGPKRLVDLVGAGGVVGSRQDSLTAGLGDGVGDLGFGAGDHDGTDPRLDPRRQTWTIIGSP